jgi:C_GCAxxG_C_C family probable redox protein
MKRTDIADSYHDRGFGCSQSVLGAFCEDYGMDPITALKISTGFGSGMGRLCQVCGALTGGFMVLGLKYGKVNSDGSKYGPATETTYALVSELARRFEETNGSILCRELIGLDLSVAENRAYAKEQNLFDIRCGKYVRDVVGLLEDLLQTPLPA